VVSGRKRIALVVASCLVVGLLLVPMAAAGPGVSVVIGGATGPEKRIKGRVIVHGPFVPGQPTSISISRMPKRAILFVLLQPIQNTPACAEILCFPTYISPSELDPNAKPAFTSGHGRAEIDFTMPTYFEGFPLTGSKLPKHPQRYPWRDHQAIQVVAAAARVNKHGDQTTGIDATKTFVQLPPPPSTS
jgi:hypothetical protein